jgi:hypothetical protein
VVVRRVAALAALILSWVCPATVTGVAVRAPLRVDVVGDSVSWDGRVELVEAFAARGWVATVDATPGSGACVSILDGIPTGVDHVYGSDAAVVVVALGSNDTFRDATGLECLDRIVAAVGGRPLVWVLPASCEPSDPRVAAVRASIVAGMVRHPNVVTVDWWPWHLWDGVRRDCWHLTERGSRLRAAVVADAALAAWTRFSSPP